MGKVGEGWSGGGVLSVVFQFDTLDSKASRVGASTTFMGGNYEFQSLMVPVTAYSVGVSLCLLCGGVSLPLCGVSLRCGGVSATLWGCLSAYSVGVSLCHSPLWGCLCHAVGCFSAVGCLCHAVGVLWGWGVATLPTLSLCHFVGCLSAVGCGGVSATLWGGCLSATLWGVSPLWGCLCHAVGCFSAVGCLCHAVGVSSSGGVSLGCLSAYSAYSAFVSLCHFVGCLSAVGVSLPRCGGVSLPTLWGCLSATLWGVLRHSVGCVRCGGLCHSVGVSLWCLSATLWGVSPLWGCLCHAVGVSLCLLCGGVSLPLCGVSVRCGGVSATLWGVSPLWGCLSAYSAYSAFVSLCHFVGCLSAVGVSLPRCGGVSLPTLWGCLSATLWGVCPLWGCLCHAVGVSLCHSVGCLRCGGVSATLWGCLSAYSVGVSLCHSVGCLSAVGCLCHAVGVSLCLLCGGVSLPLYGVSVRCGRGCLCLLCLLCGGVSLPLCRLCLLCGGVGTTTMSLSPPTVAARCRRPPSPPRSLPPVSVRRRLPGIVSAAQFRRPPSQYAVEFAYSATIGEGGNYSPYSMGVGVTTLPTLWGWGGGTTLGGGGGVHSVARRRRLMPSPPAVSAVRRGVCTEFDSGGWAQSLACYCHPSIWWPRSIVLNLVFRASAFALRHWLLWLQVCLFVGRCVHVVTADM